MTDENVEQATSFEAGDAPDGDREDGIETKQQHYGRLSIANREEYNGGWRDEKQMTMKDNAVIVDAIASQLELTEYQQAEARRALNRIPRELLGAYRSALLALCICGVIGKRDGRDYHPNNAHPNNDKNSRFVEIFEDTGAEYSKLYSCWNRVEGEL